MVEIIIYIIENDKDKSLFFLLEMLQLHNLKSNLLWGSDKLV
jgi:hypothetical protein